MIKDVKIILVAPERTLYDQLKKHFNYENVNVYNGTFESIDEYDCIVSPANSFGLMDGGMDAAIIEYFGKPVMEKVQNYIIYNYAGEQPVGTSFIIDTGNEKHPYLAHTPTMRLPMNIMGTDNIYQAMRAMLIEVDKHNKVYFESIRSVVCPGFGAGCGQVPYEIVAAQMSLAYKSILNIPTSINWDYALLRHYSVEFTSKGLNANLCKLGGVTCY